MKKLIKTQIRIKTHCKRNNIQKVFNLGKVR